jgi:hypothetical protein
VLPRPPGSALPRECGPAGEQVAQHGEVIGVGRVVRLDAKQRSEVGEVHERDQGNAPHRRRRRCVGSTGLRLRTSARGRVRPFDMPESVARPRLQAPGGRGRRAAPTSSDTLDSDRQRG